MSTLFDEKARAGMHARIDRLEATRAGLWGKMNAPQMVCHAADQLRVALGEIPTRVRPNVLRFRPLREVIVYLLPWLKGKVPTVREMLTDWAPHPAFGRIDGREWGRLCYKHLDHHLRQFAV